MCSKKQFFVVVNGQETADRIFDLNKAKKIAKAILKKMPTAQVFVYDNKDEVVFS